MEQVHEKWLFKALTLEEFRHEGIRVMDLHGPIAQSNKCGTAQCCGEEGACGVFNEDQAVVRLIKGLEYELKDPKEDVNGSECK